jgi:hypothetical protein
VFKQQFYDTFLFRQQDEPLSGKKKKKTPDTFSLCMETSNQEKLLFLPSKILYIKTHRQFPNPSPPNDIKFSGQY